MALALIEIKGLIFDLDETLLNTLDAYLAAFNAGLNRFGLKPIDKPQIANQPGRAISIRGVVVRGRGESARFTSLPWVRKQFISRMQIDPSPGTFNLEVKDSFNLKQLQKVKDLKGLEINPEESGYCGAQGFPVLIEGKIRGALIIPRVPGYPESQLEIIASVNIREALSLKDGDFVMVEVTT